MKRLLACLLVFVWSAAIGQTGPVFNQPSRVTSVTRLAEFGIAMVSAPTGTMANNGAITLGTALNATYAKCYLFLPAGSVAAGVPAAASWLYAEMSSTTVGIVYNNAYTTGVPTPPATKTAFATTGPGAYAGDTSEQGVTISIPANALGTGGRLAVWVYAATNNSVGTKTTRIRHTGSGGAIVASQANTTTVGAYVGADIFASGTTSFQIALATTGTAGSAPVKNETSGSVDTSAATSLFLSIQKGTATDYAILAPGEVLLISP